MDATCSGGVSQNLLSNWAQWSKYSLWVHTSVATAYDSVSYIAHVLPVAFFKGDKDDDVCQH